MKPNNEDFKQLIYDLMNGNINLEKYPVQESKYVENEFKKNKFCNIAYQRVYNANQRLCKRLKLEEDNDVECIISNLLDIQSYLCFKMFDYGVFFNQKETDSDEEKLLQFFRDLDEIQKEKIMEVIESL